jgi:tRNA/rRNA methyltransferase
VIEDGRAVLPEEIAVPAIELRVLAGRMTPMLGGRPVSDIVRTCHDQTIDMGLATLAVPDLTRETLEPVLTYCAEQRCVADQASCGGCRKRTEAQGLKTLEDFIAAHASIVTETGMTLTGAGADNIQIPSLEQLGRTWSGDEMWFEARRVIRKLRHGVRSRDIGSARAPRTKPSIILVEPQLPDNIGMVARAMANFGLEELRLVNPRDAWPNERARIAASGATFVIDEAQAYPTFEAALGDLTWVAATTARQRDLAKPVMTPAEAMAEARRRIVNGERAGIVFGRERNGLETSEVANADAIIMIPVDNRFASLNLAQAVLLLGYEWMKLDPAASLGRVTTYESAREVGVHGRGFSPADKAQLIGFFEHLEKELDHSGFFNPPEKRPTMVQNLRSMFTRLSPSEQEVRTLRGLVKALVLGKGPGRRG